MGLYVPMRVNVARLVLLDTCRLDLLEAPLGQVHVAGPQITTQCRMTETEGSSQSSDSRAIPGCGIVHNLNLPVILVITNGNVAVRRDFIV